MSTKPTSDSQASWPDWILQLDLEITTALNSISSIHERLRATVQGGYSYKQVLQKQINAPFDKMAAEGVISNEIIDSLLGPSRKLNKSIALPRDFVAALICDMSSAYQTLATMTFASVLAITRLLDGVSRGVGARDLLVPFVCLRVVIEHIAHYLTVIQKLRPYAVPDSPEEACRVLSEINKVLVQASYATRVDWDALVGSDAQEHIERKRIAYKPEENREDREAKSILGAIDSLDKAVKGTRAVYEMLCEFAHPNVGTLLLFTESVDPSVDKQGVWWVNKRLGPDTPLEFLKNCRVPCHSLFQKTERCLAHFDMLQGEGSKQRQKVLAVTQKVVRHLHGSNKGLLDLYSPCPCGSDKKLKFCCAK